MKKIVKEYGTSLVVTFDAEEQKIYGIKKGTIIDMTLIGISNSQINPIPNEDKKAEDVKK